MREASHWAIEMLQVARTNPAQLTTLINQIQQDAKTAGFEEAMLFATATATDYLTSLEAEPVMMSCPAR